MAKKLMLFGESLELQHVVTQPVDPMGPKRNREEEYLRKWREHTASAFTFVISLFLTFAVAALGFGLNLLQSTEFTNSLYDFQKFFLALGLSFLLLSVVFGMGAVFLRLWRFSLTAHTTLTIPNLRYMWLMKEPSRSEKIELLGKRTRWLFLIEVGTFILGIGSTIYIILSVYIDRLIFL